MSLRTWAPNEFSKPKVSVVIPFGRGTELLEVQLASIYRQDFNDPIQIVVACNHELVNEGSLAVPLPPDNIELVFVDATTIPGPSYARNVGWKSAKSDFILFCDSDDMVDRSWISAMLTALESAPVAGGRLSYEALNDSDQASWNKQTTQSLPRKFQHLEFVPSSNLGVRKEVLERLNGFDEGLTCGEDIDFCWRAQYGGYRLVFVPDAVVEYRLRSDITGLWKQSMSYGVSDAPLLLRHREFGASRPLKETLKEFAAIGLATITLMTRPKRLRKVIVRAGMFMGRVVGSYRYKIWAV